MSGYVALNNNPINVTDPDGRDVIFVNGFRTGTGDADNRSSKFQDNLNKTYWNSANPNFTREVNRYFNDNINHFVTGSHFYGSKSSSRIAEGKTVGIQMVKSGEIKVSQDNHIMTIVMHSQGNAEGVGIALGIIEQSKKQGIDVTVNLVFLSVHQPKDIKMTDELKKRGIQFTYANDNSKIVDPMGKIPGVEDANPNNKEWKKDGLKAHSATVDDPAAFEEVKKVDQKKKIFVGKNGKSTK